jgi:hypothetical protein
VSSQSNSSKYFRTAIRDLGLELKDNKVSRIDEGSQNVAGTPTATPTSTKRKANKTGGTTKKARMNKDNDKTAEKDAAIVEGAEHAEDDA